MNFTNSMVVCKSINIGNKNFFDRFQEYHEEYNYIQNRYPVRMMVLNLSLKEVIAIMDKYAIEIQDNTKKVFPITFNFKSYAGQDEDKIGKYLLPDPFDFSGNYYASFIDQILPSRLQDGFDPSKGTELDNPSSEDNRRTYRLMIYRENELNSQIGMVNLNVNQCNLSELLFTGFCQSNDRFKLLLSNLDREVQINKLLITPTSFEDFIKDLDLEFGLYKTPYSIFINNDELVLMNTSNSINIERKDNKKFSILINALAGNMTNNYSLEYPKLICNINKKNVERIQEAKTIQNENVMVHVYPDGKTKKDSENNRNVKIFYKKTMIDRIQTLNPVQREKVFLTLNNFCIGDIDYLTNVTLVEDNSNPIKLRVYKVKRSIYSDWKSKTDIMLFRNLNE